MTYEQVKQDEAVRVYIDQADASLKALGFTEHSFQHVTRVAQTAGWILETLGYPDRTVELVKIAGYLHDIGNVVNRVDHSQSGAVMAFRILDRMNFPPEEIAAIVTAIGNHDEGTGQPVSAFAAALILADKSDVRRSRVRDKATVALDIHDRVNYSVTDCHLEFDEAAHQHPSDSDGGYGAWFRDGISGNFHEADASVPEGGAGVGTDVPSCDQRPAAGIILFLNKMISSFYLSRYTADRLGGGKKCIDFVF